MPYTSASAQDRLDAVRAAIDRCLEAQRYNIGDRSKAMAELATLREMEKELQEEADRESGGTISVARVMRPL